MGKIEKERSYAEESLALWEPSKKSYPRELFKYFKSSSRINIIKDQGPTRVYIKNAATFQFSERLKCLLFAYIFELFQDRTIIKDTTKLSLEEIFTTVFSWNFMKRWFS